MLKNYLRIALRHLWKHRGYAFINVAGLAAASGVIAALGFAGAAVMIFLVAETRA